MMKFTKFVVPTLFLLASISCSEKENDNDEIQPTELCEICGEDTDNQTTCSYEAECSSFVFTDVGIPLCVPVMDIRVQDDCPQKMTADIIGQTCRNGFSVCYYTEANWDLIDKSEQAVGDYECICSCKGEWLCSQMLDWK